jgi:acyl transferase domain-containing protein
VTLPAEALFPWAPGRRVPLPTYPFERERHWVEPEAAQAVRHLTREPKAEEELNLDDTAYPSSHGQSATAPDLSLEQTVSEIWKAVLGYPQISRDDDFFALGGDSLTGMQILARIRAELNVDVPFRAVLEFSTVRSFAASLSATINARLAAVLAEVEAMSPEQVKAVTVSE